MSKALAGIRVLDLTNVLAGPFCAYQLALLGADVIKVEVPGAGDLARQLGADPTLNARHMGASFLAQNAGKKSVTLNLKTARGQGRAARLVEVGRRAGRELPARRDGRGSASATRSCAVQPAPRVLRHLRLRPGRADAGRARVRPDHPGPVGDDEHHRRRGTSAPLRAGYPVADTLGGITAAFAIAQRPGAPRTARARAPSSTCRCSSRARRRWAGWSPTTSSPASSRSRTATTTSLRRRRAPSGPATA